VVPCVERPEERSNPEVRIRIEREKCVSAENCVVSAPTVFILDDDGKARLLDPATVSEDLLWLVAEMCPTEAIVIEDDDGRQLYP
jgi:ferredoxin